jgi:hypothetical protein
MLGEKLMPEVTDIDQDPEFSATAITEGEFEAVWRRAAESG